MPAEARPLLIAHRGASGYRPEHTAAAYRLGIHQGADAVEPDIVASRDGVLVVRHENEISGTTDVADRPEFADRRTRKLIDGHAVTGWFTEDFDWAELATLRARERLPWLRAASASFDRRFPILRLRDLLELLDAAEHREGRAVTLVAEIKHAHHFASIGLPLDELFAAEISDWPGRERMIVESFEAGVLRRLTERGVPGTRVQLVEWEGAPADLVAEQGSSAPSFRDYLGDAGLRGLVGLVDGVSVAKRYLLDPPRAVPPNFVARAHAHGLAVYTWTLRPENEFLARRFRRGADPAAHGGWRAEFGAVLASGVDGVFADHPDLARELIPR